MVAVNSMPEWKLRAVRLYWVMGPSALGNEVRHPPLNGWSTAIVIGGPEDKTLTLLCPHTLQSFRVRPTSNEIRSAVDIDMEHDKLGDLIRRRWDEAMRMELPADTGIATLVLARMGQRVPTVSTRTEYARRAAESAPHETRVPREEETETDNVSSGRRKNKSAGTLVPVPRKRQGGQVLQWVMDHPGQSVKALAVDLNILPHSARAALSILNTKHGIGFQYDGDGVTALLPKGCKDPFAKEA
jgi:hypothetical protein